MRKILKATMALIVSITFVSYMSFNEAYAQNLNTIEESAVEIFELEEKESYTGIIDAEIEEELNEAGVFDSEIRNFSDDTLERLENGENYEVEIKYFEETEHGLEEMSYIDIEEYFKEIYDSGKAEEFHKGEVVELDRSEKKEKSLMEKFGFEETVYAYTDTTSTPKLKFLLIAWQSNTDKYEVYTEAQATWTTPPVYRLNDYLSISVKGKDPVYDKNMPKGGTYSYTVTSTGGSVKPEIYKESQKRNVISSKNGVGIGMSADLANDKNSIKCTDHKLKLSGYFYINSHDTSGKIEVAVDFVHQEKALSKNANISFGVSSGGEVSIAVSPSVKFSDYFHRIQSTPSLTIDYDCAMVYK